MKKILTLLAGALLLASCVKEAGPSVAKAVLGDVSVMNFPAQNPEPKTVTVVSDGTWHVTAPSWITATPDTGSGETVVTVTVSENVDAQGMLEPRKDTLILSGNKLSSRLLIIVSQTGDSYRNAQHATVSEIAALADKKAFILDEATVAAVTSAGFVVTDGSVNLYVKSVQEVAAGDKVTLKGIKGSVNGIPVISQADGFEVKSSGSCDYPEPVDLNTQIATYEAASMDYVKVSGVVSAGVLSLTVDETEYGVKQLDAPAGMSLAALNGHKATVWGYSYGLQGAKLLGVLATKIQDDGVDQVIYFEDDFEWLAPYSDATNAPDDVTANSVGSSPNIFTNAKAQPILKDLQDRGYGFVWSGKGIEGWQTSAPTNGNGQTLYLQKNYLKFGKSDYSSGLVLPAISTLGGPTDVKLTFDWCWCMTGGSKPDIMTLTVEADGVTTDLTSEQPTEGDQTKLEWQHATVIISGVKADTRIILRPTNTDPYVSNSARGQNRWYLDNIKIVPADGGSAGAPAVKVGDMLWEEWWQGGAADQKASEYCASADKTTASFGDAAITYTETGSTLLKADGLVYYNTAATAATDPQKQMNLLVAKNNGTLKAAGIPCKGVKTATLTYRSNSKLEGNHKVSTSTTGVTIGDLSATSVPKLDLETKNTYTITCPITVEAGVETLDLTITNISTSANIRVDGFELKVTEVQ